MRHGTTFGSTRDVEEYRRQRELSEKKFRESITGSKYQTIGHNSDLNEVSFENKNKHFMST